MIAAQGIGCLAATCWARLSPRDYVTRVASAVFVDPPSPAQDPARSAFASPLVPLPFASAVLSADGDRDEALDAMIRGWGSRPVAIARARRSRFPVLALLERFTSAVVEHDVQRILALQGHND
jgi:pimeloyl-ACP methyl ester carboxylesterase